MKCLMSINHKFMKYSPSELIDIIKKYSIYVDGFEIFVNVHDDKEVNYLKKMTFECKKNNLHLQIHGNSSLNINEQESFFSILNEISDYLGYKINVVIHPLTSDSLSKSIEETIIYINKLLKIANLNKIIISLENLNDIDENDRLGKSEVIPIVANNDGVYFTYDIGHEIVNYGQLTNIDSSFISMISNVHIHTMRFDYSGGFDHKPIYKYDKYWNEIIKGLLFLKINNYDGSVVFEYDLYACYGSNLMEKIISYSKSIDYVAERIK